jgi:superfamily II DNA or RNA helicase
MQRIAFGEGARNMILAAYKVYKEEDISPEELESMTIVNPAFVQAKRLGVSTRGIPQSLELFERADGLIYVPRNLEVNSTDTEVDDMRIEAQAPDMNVICLSMLSPTFEHEQGPAVKALANTIDGILVAGCGSGKTVVALRAAACLKQKTLVLVHTELLLDQWVKAIRMFLMEEAGIIQGSVCDFNGRNIVVGMVQSLAENADRYPSELYSYFGLVISDEVHRLSAPTWSKVITRFPAKRRWGLTATVNRPDGLEVVFQSHIGNVVHEMQRKGPDVTVYGVVTPIQVNLDKMENRYTHKVSFPKLITALTRDPERNKAILRLLKRAVESGRKVMVLSDRVAHLKLLRASFDKQISEVATATITGKVKFDDRVEARNAQVIFATTQIAREALDIPELDTLFMVTPTGSEITAQQAPGRIARACDDKKDPMVMDFVDHRIPICVALFNRRAKVYRKLGYEVKTVNLDADYSQQSYFDRR